MQKNKTYILHTLLLVTSLALCVLHTSCTTQDVEPSEGERACLVLTSDVLGQTRDAVQPQELIRTLRILILHADGSVEHNRLVGNLAENPDGYQVIPTPRVEEFRVKPNEKKQVILIANEYTSFNLDSYPADAVGVMEHLDSIQYTYDDTKSMPMTGVYEVPAIEEGERYETEMHIIRGVTKFTFEFTDLRSTATQSPIIIKKLELDATTNDSYLLPHFTANEPKIWRMENGDMTPKDEYILGTETYPTWQHWLVALVKGQQDGTQRTEKVYSDEDGWIMDYDIPTPDVMYHYTRKIIDSDFTVPTDGSTALVGPFYYPESKYTILGPMSLLENVQQQYVIYMEAENAIGKRVYLEYLPNLRALFRNTHVKVEITFQDGDDPMLLKAYVKPWVYGGKTHIQMQESPE